jgi:hypothetical protein
VDEAGAPAAPRSVRTSCLSEAVCRGDDRGQLWAVGPGETRAVVEGDGVRAEVPVRVVDARTAAGRPRKVAGDYMQQYEKAAEIIQREQRKAAGKK